MHGTDSVPILSEQQLCNGKVILSSFRQLDESTASVLVMQICGKTLYAVAPAQTLRCALL